MNVESRKIHQQYFLGNNCIYWKQCKAGTSHICILRVAEYRIFVYILGRSCNNWRASARTNIQYAPVFVDFHFAPWRRLEFGSAENVLDTWRQIPKTYEYTDLHITYSPILIILSYSRRIHICVVLVWHTTVQLLLVVHLNTWNTCWKYGVSVLSP